MSQKHVEILLDVKVLIQGYERYVCLAVKRASGNYSNPTDEALDILKGIHEDMGEHHLYATDSGQSLTGWTYKYHNGLILSDSDLLSCRLAWIDALIEYWREK